MPGTTTQPHQPRELLLNFRVSAGEKQAIAAWASREYGNLSQALRTVVLAQAWGTKHG
jgi:serine/threonine-protein kinase RIO1